MFICDCVYRSDLVIILGANDIVVGLKSIGNVSLTAGQFAMLLGGPFGFGNNPLTYSGAGGV